MYEEILREFKDEIKENLEVLLRDGPRYEMVGICGNALYDIGDAGIVGTDIAKLLWTDWSEYSGDASYPVEGCHAYLGGRDTLWKGEGLRKRQSLIRHMLMKLEEL